MTSDVAPVPKPSPRPAPPRPGPRPGIRILPPAPIDPAVLANLSEHLSFGRVAEDGVVWVQLPEGEREVGSVPGATPEEALAHFARPFQELKTQIVAFEQRLTQAELPLGEIDSTIAKFDISVAELKAVGDFAALAAQVEALRPIAKERHQQAEAARRAARELATTAREALVTEAEELSQTPAEKLQWRVAGNRMKELFDQWKAAQRGEQPEAGTPVVRLDRRTEDELWKRFSHARTSFDRKRRQHFAQLDEEHSAAKAAKEKLIVQAQALATSKDWAPTATAFKKLMDAWREAGRAARKDDEELWAQFKAAQDSFFEARNAVLAEQDAEFTANLELKLALLTKAEALLPVTDLEAAKHSLRELQTKWEAIGKVPRADVERVERRMQAVEKAVRTHEEDRWRQHNPEAQARARSAVEQLEAGLAKLQKQLDQATEQGKTAKIAELNASLAARQEWLVQAQKALADFGG